MALLLASLAISGHDACRPRLEAALLAEVSRQILADGGHISRNCDLLLDLSLDLLPLRQCYGARGLPVPPPLSGSIERIVSFLRRMTLDTGGLARFNGVGLSRTDTLATVLALESGPDVRGPAPGASGYVRLNRGQTTLVVDCGPAPPLAHAGEAHAGCLSFELTHAGAVLITNRGAAGSGHGRVRADARATASHSTLVLDEQSSGRFVAHEALERMFGGPAVCGPVEAGARISEAADGTGVDAWHDGYLGRYGLIHERRLELSADGCQLTGTDRLRPPGGTLRLARNLPFAVHFHVSIDARVESDATGGILVQPADTPAWRLTAAECRISIETATDYAQTLGPRPARQIVLRSVCPGEALITWRLQRWEP